jgi:hypothetical protein
VPITTQVKKITRSKPFYALAGVGPYTVAKVNEVYEDLAVRGRRVVGKVTGEAAQELDDVSVSAKRAQEREAGGQTTARARTTPSTASTGAPR